MNRLATLLIVTRGFFTEIKRKGRGHFVQLRNMRVLHVKRVTIVSLFSFVRQFLSLFAGLVWAVFQCT